MVKKLETELKDSAFKKPTQEDLQKFRDKIPNHPNIRILFQLFQFYTFYTLIDK